MRRFSFLLCTLSLLALAGVASATSINVVLLSAMGSNSFDSDVISKIQANAPFLNISVIKVDTITPSVATLEGYQAVLLMSNGNAFADAFALGNNLAQYIDDGHGLVIANNSNTNTNCSSVNNQLCGTFQTSNYWALEPGTVQSGTRLTLGTVYATGSPLMTGVTSFDGGSISNRIVGSVNSNATRIADWSDGTPLIATRTFSSGANEVALNFFPPSSDAWPGLWQSSTDGGRIMSNALLYAGNISSEDVPEPNYLVAGAGLALVSLLLRRRR